MLLAASLLACTPVWDDGTIRRVPVVAEHFIVLRDGGHWPLRFVALDENGNETYVREENYDAEVIEITL